MATTYDELIYRNPIVPYSHNNFQRESFVNHIVTMDASTKQFEIYVYGNKGTSSQLANQLKTYIESNAIGLDDISIGLRAEVWDYNNSMFKTTMVMMAGMLQVLGTTKDKNPYIVNDEGEHIVDDNWKHLVKDN